MNQQIFPNLLSLKSAPITLLGLMIFSVLLAACQKEIDVDYPESGGQLTLNSVLSPGDSVWATVSSTLAFEDTTANPYFKDAEITLYEDGELVDTLKVCARRYRITQGDSVFIYCSHQPVKAAREYELRAFKAGYPEVRGKTTVPVRASVEYIHNLPEDGGRQYKVTLQDKEDDENYFMLQLLRRSDLPPPLGRDQVAELTTTEPGVSLYSYFGILKLPTDPERGNTAYFNDEYFTGGQHTLQFEADFSSDEKANKVKLYTVSREYFRYVRALSINSALAEHPFSDPVRVPDNIENGFGLVGAATVYELDF